MKQCIEIAKTFGWDQNSNVPDPLKELNCPLLFLASAFGKTGVVEGLLRNGFNPGVVNEHGETALHAAVKHLHMYSNPTGKAFRKREDVFQRILLTLSAADPKILEAQDSEGRTALHVTAIASLDRSGFADWNKRPALFSQFCLKAMIKRLKELEAAAVLTRDEVLHIVKTTEHRNGDSVLHILAGDTEFGFETLKYILDLFLPGRLPDEKNNEGKSVFSIAWDIDSEKALMLFFSGPSQRLEQGKSSPSAAQSGGKPAVNNTEDQNQIVINIDIMEADGNQSGVPEGSSTTATGSPVPKVVVTSFDPKADSLEAELPTIAEFWSLASEGCSENSREKTRDEKSAGATSSSDIEAVDEKIHDAVNLPSILSCLESSSTDSGSSRLSSEAEAVEAEITLGRKRKKDAGVNECLSDLADEGLDLFVDTPGKVAFVGVLLTNYQQKLSQVQDSYMKFRQLRVEGETALKQKNIKMELLRNELDLLKKEISAKKRSVKDLQKREELLCKEKTNIMKKISHCETLKNQFEGKKSRSK